MIIGKRRTTDAAVKVARKSKASFDEAIAELLKRGYVIVWQHETMNFAELKRKK